jgi:hypothetical protein
MHQHLATLEIKALEEMYLKEIEILKLKLLNGDLWKDIKKQKNKAVQLALVIHKTHHKTEEPFFENFSMEE